MCGMDSFGSGYGLVVGDCEHTSDTTGSIKHGQFHE
jgi:hypothetical protein